MGSRWVRKMSFSLFSPLVTKASGGRAGDCDQLAYSSLSCHGQQSFTQSTNTTALLSTWGN